MIEAQIKEMFNGIINNGEKWECRPKGKCSYCVKCRLCDWRDYNLGDEIHDDWEYRKVEKKTWLEDYLESNYGQFAQYYIKIGATQVCKKILEGIHKHSYYENTYEEPKVIKVEEVFKIIRDLGIEL